MYEIVDVKKFFALIKCRFRKDHIHSYREAKKTFEYLKEIGEIENKIGSDSDDS